MTDPKTPPHGPPRSTKGETEIIPVGVVEEAADVALELGVDDVLVRLAPVARRAWTTAVKPFCTLSKSGEKEIVHEKTKCRLVEARYLP